MLRYLRIALSAGCGTICIALIALWVRSYWWMDVFQYQPSTSSSFLMGVSEGSFNFYIMSGYSVTGTPGNSWIQSPVKDIIPDSAQFRGSLFATAFKGFDHGDSWWQVPAWFFVICSGVLAAAPWFRWRYSLRTLLIAMTIVALALVTAIRLAN